MINLGCRLVHNTSLLIHNMSLLSLMRVTLGLGGAVMTMSMAYTKAPHAILIHEVTLNASDQQGTLCKANLDVTTRQQLTPECILIGQVKATPAAASSQQIIQIVWTGVQVQDEKRRHGYFRKPLLSTFKTNHSALPPGTTIELDGDAQEIARTLTRLEQPSTAQGRDCNPIKDERRVDGQRINLNAQDKINTAHQDQGEGQPSVATGGAGHRPQHDQLNSNRSSASQGQSASSRGYSSASPSSSTLSAPRSRPRRSSQPIGVPAIITTPQATSTPQTHVHAPLAVATTTSPTGVVSPASGAGTQGIGILTGGVGAHGRPQSSVQAPQQGALSSSARKTNARSGLTAQALSGDRATLSADSDASSRAALDKESGAPYRDDEDDSLSALSDADLSTTDGASTAKGRNPDLTSSHGKDPFAIDHEASDVLKLEAHQLIDVEITTQGCTPRVDFDKNQYVIQNRSITRQGGQIIEESPCSDSQTWYAIKRDYSVCTDEVDHSQRVAYTRFRRYWLDDDKTTKHYLDTACRRDVSQPHPFIDDPQNCTHHIDLTLGKAWVQAETLYINRDHARKVVDRCHKVGSALPIIETTKGCPLKHLFERNYSVVQKRSIFIDQGVEHMVVPCHESDDKVNHTFIKSDCQPVIQGQVVIPMAKRQVEVQGRKRLITSMCEPMDKQQLQETTEGCEGQYYDDFNAGRSYQAVRYYYLWKTKKQFVTACQRSTIFYPHEVQFLGYQNYDDILKAKPRMLITVTVNGKTMPLRTLIETNPAKFFPYTSMGTSSRVTGSSPDYTDYQSFTTWKRPDGSTYEQAGNSWRVDHPRVVETFQYQHDPYNDIPWGNW